jgi:multiple sugar transport system substrate-binding protein
MTRLALRTGAAIGTVVALTITLAACSTGSSGSDAAAGNQKVTITVADRPDGTASQAAQRKQYDDNVKAFEKANPNITLKTSTTTYDATTFQTMLAGGNLPDVLSVPFTEAKSLIANKQVANLTSALKSTGVDKIMNKTTTKLVQASNGDVYAVPTTAYSIGLVYNRSLFTKAGLDPNKPPTTWAEVRTDAKKITDATGVAGYGQMATDNTGGWMFTAISYSYGGRIENAAGTKSVFDNAKSTAALQTIQKMRWTDGSVSSNSLYDQKGLYQDYAAGKIGMMISAPDAYYTAVQQDGMSSADYGVGPMPQGGGGTNGTMTGGSIQIVSPKATSAQQVAAVKWINYNYLRQYDNKATAVAVAKASVASNNPVGVPSLSVVSSGTNAKYLGWIKDQINVPSDNFTPYTDSLASMPVAPEPVKDAQEVYAALDSVIQSVLTTKSADVPTLLKQASATVDSKLSR